MAPAYNYFKGIPELPDYAREKTKRPKLIAVVDEEPVSDDKYEFPIIPPVQVRFNECTGCQVCARVCTKMTWDAIRMLGTENFEENYSLEID
jgi:formate hydrogenlyase subunit 6/NADH:ubiquinone oxidoreductase subunit I